MSDAVTRAVRLLGATKGPSGRSTVVFDRRMATTLLSVVSSALSGEAVAKGRSFFAGRIGEQVGHPGLTLVDDPTDPRAYGAAAYDAEGLACRRNVLIDGGDPAGVPLRHRLRLAGGGGLDRLGGARRVRRHARRRGAGP